MTAVVPSDRPLRVLLAVPSALSRAGLRALLVADPRFAVVDETSSPDEAVTLARRLRPDLVVLDPAVGDRPDVETVAALAAAVPDSRLCLCTAALAARPALAALEAGAQAYLLIEDAFDPFLPDALTLVGRFGATVVGPAAAQRLRERLAGRLSRTLPDTEPSAVRLTERERAVLTLLADGLADKDIAHALGIRPGTVAVHVQHMLTKTGAKNRAQRPSGSSEMPHGSATVWEGAAVEEVRVADATTELCTLCGQISQPLIASTHAAALTRHMHAMIPFMCGITAHLRLNGTRSKRAVPVAGPAVH